jgi:hypothetical protein
MLAPITNRSQLSRKTTNRIAHNPFVAILDMDLMVVLRYVTIQPFGNEEKRLCTDNLRGNPAKPF